jgi:hypothetical protein
MSEPNGFWEQYKENVRESNRRAPWRLLRLLVAFGLSILLAPCCAAAAAITGEPMAAMVVAVVGILCVAVVWRTMLWLLDRSSPSAPAGVPYPHAGFAPSGYSPQQPASSAMPAGQSPFAPVAAGGLPPTKPRDETPFPTHAGFVQPAYAAQLPGQPILGASTGPVPPFAHEPPPARSGAGCAMAAVAIIGVMFLSCCGGGVAILATQPNLKVQVGPQQPMAVPAGGPFGFPGPMAGPPGAFPAEPIPNDDPFEEMRRAQEEMRRAQEKSFQDFIEENKRQMREFDEEFRKQNEAFGRGF